MKSKFIRQFEFSDNLEDFYGNVAGEQGLALQQLFPYKSSYSFTLSDCHKFSFYNDGSLKLGHFDIFDTLSIFGIRQVIDHNFMKLGHVMA